MVMLQKVRFTPKVLLAIAGLSFTHAALQAQTIWLPGSDSVNIARAGAGVAFGRSLEACSLNPALLVTLRDHSSAFFSAGMEMQSTQLTLPSNELVYFSADRNRFLPALGAAWRFSPKLAFGLKIDSPFMRHAELPMESSSRFFGHSIDLNSQRTELQISYAISDAFSLGLSAGVSRFDYASALSLRALVPTNPEEPSSVSNPTEALLETIARQAGNVLVPTFAIGFRYAANSRWTVGGSFTSGAKGSPSLSASLPYRNLDLYNKDYGTKTPPPNIGSEEKAQVLMDALSAYVGGGNLAMPYKIQVGVRQRHNTFMTWEIDLRYMGASSMELPAQPGLNTPSGQVSTLLDRRYEYKNGLGFSTMMELTLDSNWSGRAGISYDPALRMDEEVDAMLGGAKSVAFSVGFSRKYFGGELSVGYQYRQAQDKDAHHVEGKWLESGLKTTGTPTRVEGMGHLWSFGYKKSF